MANGIYNIGKCADWSIGHSLEFQNWDIFQSLKIGVVLANCADPEDMPHDVSFHLGLYCLPKYPVYKGLSYFISCKSF